MIVPAGDPEAAKHPDIKKLDIAYARNLPTAVRKARMLRWRPHGIIAMTLLLLLGFGAYALAARSQESQANRQRTAAQNYAATVQLIRESEALGNKNPTLARLEAVAAWRLDPTPSARYAMLEAASLPEVASVSPPGGGVMTAAFSPDGNVLATGNENGTTQLWDVTKRRQIGTSIHGNSGSVQSLAFSPDGKYIAVAENYGVTQVWNISNRREIARLVVHDSKQMRTLNATATSSVAFSPTGILVTGSYDGLIRLWNVSTGRLVGRPLKAAPLMLPDYIADGGDSFHGVKPELGPDDVETISFSPDGRVLAAGYNDGTMRLWNLASRRQIGVPFGSGPLGRSALPVSSIAFSPDGTTVAEPADPTASSSSRPVIWLWNVRSHKLIGTITSGRIVDSVAFSPDGSTLIGGNQDGATQLWDMSTHDQIGTSLSAGAGEVSMLTYSPNGELVATVSADGTSRLWNMSIARWTGKSLTSAGDGPGDYTNSLSFSPDGKVLVVDNGNCAPIDCVRLWSTTTHRLVRILPTEGPLTLSPNGKIIADESGQLWSVATGQEPARSRSSNMPSRQMALNLARTVS